MHTLRADPVNTAVSQTALGQPLADVTVWQAGALVLALIVGIGWLARKVWPVVVKVKDFLDDWNGEPARPGAPARPGIGARLDHQRDHLQALEDALDYLQAQMKTNGGSTLRDAIDRIDAGQRSQVRTLEEHIEISQADREDLRRMVTALQAERADVHSAVDALTTETAEHHEPEE